MIINRNNAYLTGVNGSYSTDSVKAQNELNNPFNCTAGSYNAGNYKTAFVGGIDGSVHIGQPDYNNPRNTIHNNIADKVLGEQIFENRLLIDSAFRDYVKYQNPFNFVVKFNGVNPKKEDICVDVDGETYCYPKYIDGDTAVLMDRVFKNVKSVIINTLILPHSIEYKTDENGDYDKPTVSLVKMRYKYIILRIHELSNDRLFSNNKAYGREAFIMKFDDDTCINWHRWIPIEEHIFYPDSVLKFIDRLTVEICDDKGNILCPKLNGKPHDFFKEYRLLIDKVLYLQQKKRFDEVEALQPKLESLKKITECLSPELHCTFCTLDPQIATLPQFRY